MKLTVRNIGDNTTLKVETGNLFFETGLLDDDESADLAQTLVEAAHDLLKEPKHTLQQDILTAVIESI